MRTTKLNRLSNVALNKFNPYFLVYYFLFRDLKYSIEKFAQNKVLDIGCGNKPYRSFFKEGIDYLGCDIVQSSENKVDVVCLATEIPLPNSSFDTIISTQTIEHVFDHESMLREALRLLQPNGVIIVSGPMYWPHHEEPYDFFRFTKYGFKSLFEKVGFEIIQILPNGGKWALWGLATLHTFPNIISGNKIFKFLINSVCLFLDDKFQNFKNTSNFVVVAKKP